MRREAEGDDGFFALPVSDLFLALGALFIFALFVLQPSLRFGGTADGGPLTELAAGRAELGGRTPLLLLADTAGLVLKDSAGPAVRTSRDAIVSDAALARRLAEARDQPILLAIAADGSESAFLAETALQQAGVAAIRRLRLDAACSFRREPAASPASCAADLAGLPR
ncbi:hypothetical protein [Aureimonas leprariae]|nr:hypothetical protein [Aureimonas leprariae]